MKKIAFIVRDLAGGGVERTLFNLLDAIDKTKYEVTLLVFSNTGKMISEIPSKVRVVDLSEEHYLFSRVLFDSKEGVRKLLKRGKFFKAIDLVIFDRKSNYLAAKKGIEMMYHYYSKKLPDLDEYFDLAVDFYGYGDYTGAYIVDKVKADKKVTWIHDENQPWIKALKSYYPQFNYIFACSKRCAENFQNSFPQLKDKTRVLYNLIPVDTIIELSKKNVPELSTKTNLLTVGRLSKQKGYDIAIEAAKILKQEEVPFTWYFVGAGVEETNLKKMVRDYNLEEQVIFCGFDLNPYCYMAACDIYVQPSRHEGYCTTITEAFVLGKPIIATDVSGVREQLIHGKTGIILEAMTALCLAKQLKIAIENKQLIENIIYNVNNNRVDFDSEVNKLLTIIDMR